MKYLKLFEDIDINWDDVDEEEYDESLGPMPQGLTIKEYETYIDRKVRINHNSEHYEIGYQGVNPADLDGIITKLYDDYKGGNIPHHDDYIFEVDWDNGQNNQYQVKDLDLV